MPDFTKALIAYAIAQIACGMVIYYSSMAAHDRALPFKTPFTRSRIILLVALVFTIPAVLFSTQQGYLERNPFAVKAVAWASLTTALASVLIAAICAKLPDKVSSIARGVITALASFAFFVICTSTLTSAYFPRNADFNPYFSSSGSIFEYCILPSVFDNEGWLANVPDYQRRVAHLHDESLVRLILTGMKARKRCNSPAGLVARVEASAVGAAMKPIDVDPKPFSSGGAMTWAWRLTALEPGTQYVHFRLYLSRDASSDTSKLSPVYEETRHLSIISGLGDLFIPLLPVALTVIVPLIPLLWGTVIEAQRRSKYIRLLGPDGKSSLVG